MSYLQKKLLICVTFLSLSFHSFAQTQPNIIVVFTDDISARELPIYGSDTWSPPAGGDTQDTQYRANTPILDMMATQGCYIETAWAATVCSPSRAMMMTGRYAHLHKWYGNDAIGQYTDPTDGSDKTIPLYVSSPRTLGHIASEGGYATLWAGKTQMRGGDVSLFSFDEGIFTAGGENLSGNNPFTNFELANVGGVLTNLDTGNPVDNNDAATYKQRSWYWKTSASTMVKNTSGGYDYSWWPTEQDDIDNFSENTYGPDVELDYILDFMDRKVAENKPFFIYHTSHLGHDGFDFLQDGTPLKWPGTPKVSWDGTKYNRTTPNIVKKSNPDGSFTYNTNNTVTGSGIHHHVNYLDYQMEQYLNKLEELGVENNTLIIFTSDNGTSGFGKNQFTIQKGVHVPFIIYGPGLGITKTGKQDVLFNIADVLPTIAEIGGVDIPCDYEINGESFWSFLTTSKADHRDWVYGYRSDKQLIRDQNIIIDGRDDVFDAQSTPSDLTNFTTLATDLTTVLPNSAQESAKNSLASRLPNYSMANFGQNGLPDPSVNGSSTDCSSPTPVVGITVNFETATTAIETDGSINNPIVFTIGNIPNNTASSINIRIYPITEDISQGEYVAQFSGTSLDINSATADVNTSDLTIETQINTPQASHITRTYTLNNTALRSGRTITPGEQYVVALRFVQGGTTGSNPLTFSTTTGEQPATGTASSKHAVFNFNTLTATTTLSASDFIENGISGFIYPNPVNTMLNVDNNLNLETYRIINLFGQEVSSGKLENNQINVNSLTEGIYFLVTDKGVGKFIKQ